MAKKSIGYAFWKYDLFPYHLGAEYTEMLDGQRVNIPSYGPNASIKPKFVMSVKDGRELAQKLEALRCDRQAQVGEINLKFKAKLDALLAKY